MSSPCCKPTKGCATEEQPKYEYFYSRDGYEHHSQDSCCPVEQPRGQCCGGFNGAPLSNPIVGRPACNSCPGDVETSESVAHNHNHDNHDHASYHQEDTGNPEQDVMQVSSQPSSYQQEELVKSYSQAAFDDQESDQMSGHMEQMYRQCGSCGGGGAMPNYQMTSEQSADLYNQNELVGDHGNATGSPGVNVSSSELEMQPQYNTPNSSPYGQSMSRWGNGVMNRFNHPWMMILFAILILAGLAYGGYYLWKHYGKKM